MDRPARPGCGLVSDTRLPLREVIKIGRRSLDLGGDGDWTPQDAALSMLIVAVEDVLASAPSKWLDDADLFVQYTAWREALGA